MLATTHRNYTTAHRSTTSPLLLPNIPRHSYHALNFEKPSHVWREWWRSTLSLVCLLMYKPPTPSDLIKRPKTLVPSAGYHVTDATNIMSKRFRWSRGGVLAFGTQVRGFKPRRSRRIFQGEELLSTPSFGGEVKSSVPCCRFTACKRFLNAMWKSGISGQN